MPCSGTAELLSVTFTCNAVVTVANVLDTYASER
jgi:hypothetical protein